MKKIAVAFVVLILAGSCNTKNDPQQLLVGEWTLAKFGSNTDGVVYEATPTEAKNNTELQENDISLILGLASSLFQYNFKEDQTVTIDTETGTWSLAEDGKTINLTFAQNAGLPSMQLHIMDISSDRLQIGFTTLNPAAYESSESENVEDFLSYLCSYISTTVRTNMAKFSAAKSVQGYAVLLKVQ